MLVLFGIVIDIIDSFKLEESMNKNKITKNLVLYSIIGISIVITVLFGYNVVQVLSDGTTGSGNVIKVDNHTVIEEYEYHLGNNPTDIQIEYFEGLDLAVEDGDTYKMVEYVTKSFVADFFTWTNKDGNYEVGGLTYIYGPMFTSFQNQARWEFYSDLDAYIEQYGRENLLEVTSVETSTVRDSQDFTFMNNETYSAYYVEATWQYKPSDEINVNEFQQVGYFTLIDNNGRIEIASFYDSWE